MNIKQPLKQAIKKSTAHFLNSKNRVLLFLALGILLPYLDIAFSKIISAEPSLERSGAVLFFLAFPILRIRSRIAIFASLIVLLLLPILLILRKLGAAEQLAIVAYGLLLTSFVWAFIESVSDNYNKKLLG